MLKNRKREPLVEKKVLLPFILVTSLFTLWGFANAVTDPMVQSFKKVLELSNAEAAWVQMAFYGGYFCMALPAALFIRKYSYKTSILIGLALYAIGALLFYPAANTQQFWFFCLGLYILTFGLAFLETSANPYILALGSPESATRRLNLAQAFNPLGLILGLLVAQYFVLKELKSDNIESFTSLLPAQKALIRTTDLMVIRDPYVVLGLLVLMVFVIVLVTKMPQTKTEGSIPSINQTFKILGKKKTYIFGVIAQVAYVGAQIMCWTYIYQYAEAIGISSENAANFQFVAFLLFFLGRAIGTYLLRYITSALLLMISAVVALVLILATVGVEGSIGLDCLVAVSLFMSIMFPTIYGVALFGLQEEETKIGAAGLVMAIVGGALMPKLQGMVIDLGGPDVDDISFTGVSEVNASFLLPAICFYVIGRYGWFVFKNDKS